MTFAPDPKIAQIAEAYSVDAVDLMADQFNVKLDWSDGSIRHVETALNLMHKQLAHENPQKSVSRISRSALEAMWGKSFERTMAPRGE